MSKQAPQTYQDMQQCIQNCLACHRVCMDTITYCLQQGGKHAMADHVRLLMDCAEICQTSANFMIRGSALHKFTCAVCAEICLQCAEACNSFGNDPKMELCQEASRHCAESCKQMSNLA